MCLIYYSLVLLSKLSLGFFTNKALELDELYKMNFHNKFKLTVFSCLVSQQIYALNLMPIEVQSAPGELLYAEISFQHADPNQPLYVGLATAEDLNYLGVHHQPPGHLSFFVRQSSSDTGVITITSSRPVIETELNVVVKIQHAGATRLQHIKTRLADLEVQQNPVQEKSLVPVKVVREEEIALNLPIATQHNATKTTMVATEKPLQVKNSAPPLLQGTALSAQAVATASAQTTAPSLASASATVKPVANQAVQENLLVVQKIAPPPLHSQASTAFDPSASVSQMNTSTTQPVKASALPSATQQHVVQKNESLWGISAQIAKQHQLSTTVVMRDIQANNPQAFIGGDPNKLRRGATLNFNLEASLIAQDKIATQDLAQVTTKQSGKAKYRLNEAQMSLVAEKQADSVQGSAKKSTQSTKSSEQLALKVMTAREKSVKLQRNVTHLDQTLKQKDHRIQVLNTRLAQLQQQLKAQQVQKK